jgi:hypothetical protein
MEGRLTASSIVARLVFAAALIDFVAFAVWTFLGGTGAGEGCGDGSADLWHMGRLLITGSLWLGAVAVPVMLLDRQRGRWSIACAALVAFLVYFGAPRFIC